MNRRTLVISAVAVAVGCVALVIFMFMQDAEPFAQTTNPDTAVLACASQASAQGSGGCALATGGGKGCGGCPAMASIAPGVDVPRAGCASKQACAAKQACVGNPACAPNPACCPDGCPSIKDGKCPHAGACICPGGQKGCTAMKAGTCPGKTVQTTCGAMKTTGCAMAAGTQMKASGCPMAAGAQTAGTQMAGCPAGQAGASKQASCAASCPFSSK